MQRRTLLKLLAIGPFFTPVHAAPPKTMKGIEEMQTNWKTLLAPGAEVPNPAEDRKSTRLNSSHGYISYAVFCLKKKKNKNIPQQPVLHTPLTSLSF